ncbi:helix-turn-helix transcriptional regulator [Alteromonas sp. PRIM-21]|nr:helix-turn-helix transcriptional regulator [Alteromonas sp. PRIM-21]
MKFSVKDVKQLGKAAQLVRKTQGLDQMSVASLSSNGTTFLSEFENGKPTVELGRVLRVLDSLGIAVTIDIPIEQESLSDAQRKRMSQIIDGIDL